MSVTINGTDYADGQYAGFCYREKAKRTFTGTAELTNEGRVLVTGPCDKCKTLITTVLYAP